MPLPDLSNKPGPGRPGWPSGDLEFKLEIQGPGTFNYNASRAAGNTSYSIKFGDGATLSNVGAGSITHTYGAGTFILEINSEDDSGPIDTFQVTGVQANKDRLKKILNWGTVAWVNLNTAFQHCHGLTNIDKSDFYSASAINLTSAFQNCDNLTTVDFTGWKASGNVTGANMFRDCTALESFKLKGSIKFANASSNNYWFRDAGASTGCLFDISNLNFAGSTGNQGSVQGWFFDAQIKNGSKFDNWNFPAANWALNQFFYDAHVPDNDATISIKNWTLPNNASTAVNQLFRNLQTDTGSGTNLTLNMSNWNFGNITGLVSFMQNARMSSIVGLNTWTANNLQNINNFFATTASLGIDPNDNFTTNFWNNSNISNCNFAFQSLGGNTTSATAGAFPALNGMTVASGANFQQIFENTHFNSDASFTGVTFPASTINFSLAFYTAEFFNSNSTIDFSNSNLKSFTYNTTFRRCTVDNIVFGSNVDFSAVTSWLRMFKADTGDTSYPDQNVTFPTNISFAATTDTREFPNIPFTTCQADNLIRALYATKPTASSNATTFDLTTSAITAAPSVVNGLRNKLVSPGGWNITANSTDAALPFAYPAYGLDPAVYPTGISPTTIPSGAVFSTTTSGVTVNASTGVVSYASTFRGGITVKCTYTNGCYNEVGFIVQVPFVMRTVIPASGSTSAYVLKPQMSANECFVNWGDTVETLTGNTTHNYPASGSDTTYDIEIFDSPGGSKFEGFNAAWDTTTITSYENSIMKWGEIQWKNNSWFVTGLPNSAIPKLRLSAPNGASHKPDLSQVTSLYRLFYNKSKSRNLIWEDVNNNLANWDTSTITNMAEAFVLHGSPGSRPSDSQPNIMQLSNWNTSNVTNMSQMFLGAAVTANGVYTSNIGVDVTNWNTQNVENFSGTFRCKGTLTGAENLRTESCTNMSSMFNYRTLPDTNTKYVNGILRWDVSKVSSFASFANRSGGTSGSIFPSKWKLSGDGQDVNMNAAFYGFDFDINDSPDLCATKTVNETWYGGTSYTAWDMSNTTNISNMFRGAGTNAAQAGPPTGYNPNIGTWQISNKFTTMQYFARADGSQNRGLLGIDQDLGHWDVTNVSSPNGLLQIVGFRVAGERPNFSRANYDSILSIADGWGSQAANVNSGVNMDFGFSQYSPGNQLAFNWGANNNPPGGIPSGQNIVYSTNLNLKNNTNVGDIVYWPGSGSTYADFAKITGYLPTSDYVAYITPLTGNWPTGAAGTTKSYQVYDSNAAKGRFALLEAGWNITDGGVDLSFESAEIEIELAPGEEAFGLWTFSINAKIDWGDGNGFVNNPATGQPWTGTRIDFTYPTVAAGTTDIYRIKVRETDSESFSGFRFGFGYQYGGAINQGGRRVRKIISWGSQIATSYATAFEGADLNKAGFTNTLPVDSNGKVTKPQWISSVSSFSEAFRQCNLPANTDFSNWATGLAAENLSLMFYGNTNFVGTGLANWNLTNVTNMSSFVNSTAFNSDISGWDLQSCTNASGLFANTPFNHSSISNLNLHSITNISSMFENCTAFNQDVNTKVVGSGASAYLAWDTDSVTSLYGCFKSCSNFNYSINKWNIGQLDQQYAMASFFAYVATNVTGGYTHDLLTKDVTVGAGTPVAKTYVAWDVGQVNGFGGSSQNYTTTLGMFYYSNFNGDISNWDMSGLGAQGGPVYSSAGQWGRVFQNNDAFNQDISTKTITNVSGKGTYTAWDMSNWTGGRYAFYQADAFNQNLGNWALSTTDTSSGDMLGFFGYTTAMTTANYTDSFTGWANTAKTNNGFPKNKGFGRQYNKTFDTTRTNGITAFTVNTAGRARSYLTLDVTVSSGASTVNGVYYYDYANSKWVKESDADATIEWNTEESTWDVSYEGVVQHNGTGGSQAAGPESSTSWSGGISVVDSSLGWSISDDTITT